MRRHIAAACLIARPRGRAGVLRWLAVAAAAGALAAVVLPRLSAAQQATVQFKVLPAEIVVNRLRTSSPDNAVRESNLRAMFVQAGCDSAHLVEQPVKHAKQPNVTCTLPGSTGTIILVGAHFDHVNRGEGVVDNWSGTALLPSLYESLNGIPRKHTFVFVGFAAEEEGLVGSAFYASQLSGEELAKIRAMVNMDSLGLGPTKLWIDHSDKDLAHSLFSVANAMQLPIGVVNADYVGDDDSSPFRKRHIPTVMLHSITQETLPVLHTEKDNLAAVRVDDYYDSYRLIAEYLAYIDTRLD